MGDQVFLKVYPYKGKMRFGKRRKLSPRYVGPFLIVERIGPMAYCLTLSQKFAGLHDVFHVSMLKKYQLDTSHVIPRDEVQVQAYLTYEVVPVEIFRWTDKVLRNKIIPMVKVYWQHHTSEEVT